MTRRARLSFALLASAAAHAAILLALSSATPPPVPGMPSEAMHVTLLVPHKSASGSHAAGHRSEARREESVTPRKDLPHDGEARAPGWLAAPDASPMAQPGAPARDPDAATIAAHTLQAMLHEAFAAHFHYPPLARQKGWQGEVRLALRIEPDGKLARIRVITSSGYGILDITALHSLEAVQRLPRAATLLKGSGLNLVLPVRYQLFDS